LKDHLAHYKVPRSIECVRERLRDDAGKLRRSALRAARI
jgi:bile acid-coenzyme A ligase